MSKKYFYLYYIFYLFIAWSIIVYFIHSSETIISLAKFIIWGIPLIFIYHGKKIQIFNEKNNALDFKIITVYIFATLILLLLYAMVINQALGYSVSTSVSIWFVLNGVIFAPIIEEFIFRGYLLQTFQNNFTFGKANTIQSLLFVFIHFPQWLARGTEITIFSCSWIFVFGIILGFLKKKTNWLYACMIVHSVGNVLLKIFLDS